VRGLDYYRRTTFEFVHPLLGAQSTIGAGGRYDGLSQAIDGPPLPGIGWALGVDRTLLALEAEGVLPEAPPRSQVFFVPLGAAAQGARGPPRRRAARGGSPATSPTATAAEGGDEGRRPLRRGLRGSSRRPRPRGRPGPAQGPARARAGRVPLDGLVEALEELP
jgi:histidyl-tRNA synthetase